MSTQIEKPKDNLLVKLVKKSVGLPTSDCCGVSAQAQGTETCCSEQLAIATESTSCGCSQTETASSNSGQKVESCCGAQPSASAESSDCGCAKTEAPTCGCGQEKKAESKVAA